MIRSRNRARGGKLSGTNTIKDFVSGAVFELWASDIRSYPGTGQTVSNIIASPADGQAASYYNMVLGTSSSAEASDPTFTGTAGAPGAYFLCDGGDNILGVTTPASGDWLANLTRTDQNNDWWVVVAGRYADAAATSAICGNASTGTSDGFRIALNTASSNSQFFTCDGAACVFTTMTSVQTYGTDTLVVLKYNSSTLETKRAYNSRTFTTFTHAAFTNTTSAAIAKLGWGGATSSARVGNGSRLYGFAMGQGDLNNTILSRIADYCNSKVGVTFV